MKKKTNYFDSILITIIIVLTVLVVFWVIQLLFGGSPRLNEFNFAVILLIISILFKIYREIGEMKVGIKYSFNKIGSDVSLIKNKLKIK